MDIKNTTDFDLHIDRSKTCCFTGHRPEKIFDGAGFGSEPVRRLISVIGLHINELIAEGYDTFITGMARGVDMWAARLVMDAKIYDPSLKLICAMPYRNHGAGFRGVDLWELNNILEDADRVIYTAERYSNGCMSVRNRFMVDNSSQLLGVVSDYRSGTGQTIRYAKAQGLKCDIIDLNKSLSLFLSGTYT